MSAMCNGLLPTLIILAWYYTVTDEQAVSTPCTVGRKGVGMSLTVNATMLKPTFHSQNVSLALKELR